jgi:peptide/nickel transport system substrate-binding protein
MMRVGINGRHRWRVRLVAGALILALGAAACGDDGGTKAASNTGTTGTGTTGASSSGSGTGGTGSAATTTAAPVKGGTITVGTYSNAVGLDPAKIAGGGTVGGMENAALYDTIVRYNNVTGKYEPRTGEFTANADNTVWTLKLKSGIKFADGTAYDAAAVNFVVSREMKDGNSSPKGQLLTFLDADPTKSIKVVDPLTVQFTLKLAWADFPYLFANVQGWIYSPTQFAKVGDPVKFNADPGPAGAGPFQIKSYKPNESLELVKNPTYWGGDVYLDGIIFKQLATPQATLDAIQANTMQAAYVRDPTVQKNAIAAKLGHVDMPTMAANIININSATIPVKVRQAVAAAIDDNVVNQRAYQGNALPDSAPFANGPYDPKEPGPKYDLATAKTLLADAKAAGFSGKIRLFSDASVPDWGIAISTMLTAAGFVVDLQAKPISEVVTAVLTNKDYDLTTWAYGMSDELPTNYVQLAGTFAAPAGRYGYSSPEMVAAIDLMRTASTDAQRTAAYAAVTKIWTRDVPAVVTTSAPTALIFSAKLHGAVRTAGANILFDKAYLDK